MKAWAIKYLPAELLAGEVLKPLFIPDASATALPVDWPKVAADVIVRLAELINDSRAARADLRHEC